MRDEVTTYNTTIEELEEEITEIEQLVSTTMNFTLCTIIMDASNGTFRYDAVVIVPAYFNYSQCQATEDDGTTAGLFELNIINESPMNYSCNMDEDDSDTHLIPTETSNKMKSVIDGTNKFVLLPEHENVTNKDAGPIEG